MSAQFAMDIPAFAKPTFERLRRTRHSAQYFDPSAAPITASELEQVQAERLDLGQRAVQRGPVQQAGEHGVRAVTIRGQGRELNPGPDVDRPMRAD